MCFELRAAWFCVLIRCGILSIMCVVVFVQHVRALGRVHVNVIASCIFVSDEVCLLCAHVRSSTADAADCLAVCVVSVEPMEMLVRFRIRVVIRHASTQQYVSTICEWLSWYPFGA